MQTLIVLVTALPWILVWVVAGVLAALWWNRHPTVSALVVTASVIHVLTIVAGRVVPMVWLERGETAASLGIVSAAIGLVELAGSICMVAAVFAGRQGLGSGPVSPPR
jgi:hypothetical protein